MDRRACVLFLVVIAIGRCIKRANIAFISNDVKRSSRVIKVLVPLNVTIDGFAFLVTSAVINADANPVKPCH